METTGASPQSSAPPAPAPIHPHFEHEWVEPNILMLRDAIPGDIGREFIKLADKLNHYKPATIIAGPSNAYEHAMRTSTNMFIGAVYHPDLAIFEGRLEVASNAGAAIYRQDNTFVPVLKGHSPFELLRYQIGGHFDTHVDAIYGHPALEYRRLSLLVYMNDDYDGGELCFPRQRIMLKPRGGSLVLFPSGFDYPHVACPVRSGTKYCVVSWFF
jgi:hypothetical protein